MEEIADGDELYRRLLPMHINEDGTVNSAAFKSVAWGDADEASDLDVMLLLDRPAGYREVTRLRVADVLGRPLLDGPRFIDLDRRSAQTFEEGERRWFQRIVNSIILTDTNGWYEGIRVQTSAEYATPACRRARWRDCAERANTERTALSRAREMGDGPLAALRLDRSAWRPEVALALAGELLDLGQQVVTGADGMAPT